MTGLTISKPSARRGTVGHGRPIAQVMARGVFEVAEVCQGDFLAIERPGVDPVSDLLQALSPDRGCCH